MTDKDPRDLSKYERLVLINQYKILEAVDPDNADDYAKIREGIEWGYQYSIDALFEHVFDGLTRAHCALVINAMAVYDALQRSFAALEDESGIDEWRVKFPGFDGNNETSHMAYARHVVENEGRFTYLKLGNDGFNSHMRLVGSYRAMIDEWERMGKSYELSKDQIRSLLDVR